jgi:hypothetical protein
MGFRVLSGYQSFLLASYLGEKLHLPARATGLVSLGESKVLSCLTGLMELCKDNRTGDTLSKPHISGLRWSSSISSDAVPGTGALVSCGRYLGTFKEWKRSYSD